ncbi:TPA: toll/interleukin-1 receptor domain-containing protein [Bacillus pseudomycoides]|nr:toll/interleukin-1 receptor domain-containing protein [Bacillus pseudomycoides]
MAHIFHADKLREIAKNSAGVLQESSNQILKSASTHFSYAKQYDIFLSHSFKDAQVILGLKLFLESLGLSVYVDWIDDRQLDRSYVNTATADVIRNRMKNCKTLILASSYATPDSKWVPWEVGYFDGINGRIAVLPITEQKMSSETYIGQEYLGLYSYAVDDGVEKQIWIQNSPSEYISLQNWVKGKNPYERGA